MTPGTNTNPAYRPGGVVDWEAVRRQVAATAASLERHTTVAAEDKRTILTRRAKELATARQTGGQTDYLEIIEFELASEVYGIELRHTLEVSVLKDLTPVPSAPVFVLGIINVHGRVMSVVDLKRFFDLPGNALTDLNRVIVISRNNIEIGILADRIHGVCKVSRQSLQPSLPTLKGARAEYLKGVTEQRLIVLDAEKLLSDPKIVVQQELN